MARLNQQHSVALPEQTTDGPAVQMASSIRTRQSPDKAGASYQPSVKPKQRVGATATDFQIRARQQRSFRLPHVDSLLLHPIANSISTAPPANEQRPRSDEYPEYYRRSPTRKAKANTSSVYAKQLPNVIEDENAASDWEQYGHTSEAESACSDENVFTFATPTKSIVPPLKALSFYNVPPRRPLDVIDQTSPVRNAQIPKIAPSQDIRVTDLQRPISSSDAEPAATLRFSPPTFKKPLVSIPRNRTPSPPASPSRSRLTSPKKKAARIPNPPHRQSLDAFWNPAVVNAWNDEYSPRKVLQSSRKLPISEGSDDDGYVSPSSSPRKKSSHKQSPIKQDKAKTAAKKAFEKEKHTIADDFIADMENKISKGQIKKLTEASGGIKIIWSRKLNSTAGRANWKREGTKSRNANGEVVVSYKHIASIELAEKVIDDGHRLLNVLAHEYCHLLNFMVSNIRDQPHGPSFKRWARLVTSTYFDRGVEVTTKHSYTIDYKYAWVCDNDECATQYERHSKSVDPSRNTCGKCRGRLIQIRPAPRGGTARSADGAAKKETEYQMFVKDQFSVVKKELEAAQGGQKSPMKDVMKEVGFRYRSRQAPTAEKTNSDRDSDAANFVDIIEVTDDESDNLVTEEMDDPRLDVARKLDFLTISSEKL